MRDARNTPMTVVVVAADGTEVPALVACAEAEAPGAGRANLALLDALARQQLAASRRGGSILVRGAGDDLRDLLELAGLDGVLRLEPSREAELGEEVRPDEVVQADDLPG